MSSGDVSRLIEALPEEHRAPMLLAVGCGLRAGEVYRLRLDDVDMLRGVVRVRQQRGTDERIGPPKTQASHRSVPLPTVVRDALALHPSRQPTDGLIFPIKRNTAHVAFRKAADRVRLTCVRFHDLRHTYASALIAAGESVKVVQTRLGHAQASETLNTYAHLFPNTEDSTKAAVDAFLEHQPTENDRLDLVGDLFQKCSPSDSLHPAIDARTGKVDAVIRPNPVGRASHHTAVPPRTRSPT